MRNARLLFLVRPRSPNRTEAAVYKKETLRMEVSVRAVTGKQPLFSKLQQINASDNRSEILIRGKGCKSPWASTEVKQGELGKAKQSTLKQRSVRLSLL